MATHFSTPDGDALRIGPPLSVGGAGTGRRHGITSSRCALSGGPAEDPVGRGAGGKREEPVQDPGPPCRQEKQPGGK
jgi:hypothetical protein